MKALTWPDVIIGVLKYICFQDTPCSRLENHQSFITTLMLCCDFVPMASGPSWNDLEADKNPVPFILILFL